MIDKMFVSEKARGHEAKAGVRWQVGGSIFAS